jgi:peptidoglycan hydrolase-like protein with peptidoglycan-binding domain
MTQVVLLVLAMGSSGPQVCDLQRGLSIYSRSTAVAATCVFGPTTKSKVMLYQAARDIAVDGIVGMQTWTTPAGAAGATLASLSGLDHGGGDITPPPCTCP